MQNQKINKHKAGGSDLKRSEQIAPTTSEMKAQAHPLQIKQNIKKDKNGGTRWSKKKVHFFFFMRTSRGQEHEKMDTKNDE